MVVDWLSEATNQVWEFQWEMAQEMETLHI